MLHTKFCGKHPAGSGEEDFLRVLTIYGHDSVCNLGHVTSIMSSDFHFLVPESFHTKFGPDRQSISEKIQFEFLYVHDLGPRSKNDLDLQYSHILMYSIRCLLQPNFRSLAAIVSENPLFTLFPIEKPKLPNLTLPQNRSRSLQGHHLNKL